MTPGAGLFDLVLAGRWTMPRNNLPRALGNCTNDSTNFNGLPDVCFIAAKVYHERSSDFRQGSCLLFPASGRKGMSTCKISFGARFCLSLLDFVTVLLPGVDPAERGGFVTHLLEFQRGAGAAPSVIAHGDDGCVF